MSQLTVISQSEEVPVENCPTVITKHDLRKCYDARMHESEGFLPLLRVASCAVAQSDESKKPPIIDIHVHAME